MYRAPRAIDVVTTEGTMAGRTAVDRTVTAARDGRSARTEGGRRSETAIAKRAWARRASRRAPPARARRAAPSADARCARAPPTGEPPARAAPSPRADSRTDR